jgi:hypothetical protein
LVFALRARRAGRHLRQQFGERFHVKSINQAAKIGSPALARPSPSFALPSAWLVVFVDIGLC